MFHGLRSMNKTIILVVVVICIGVKLSSFVGVRWKEKLDSPSFTPKINKAIIHLCIYLYISIIVTKTLNKDL